MTHRFIAPALAALALTACTADSQRPAGVPFAASVSPVSEDARDVTVSLSAPGATVEQVRDSARYGVTRYCLERFGASDAVWTRDPSTGDWAIGRDGDRVVLSARCTFR